VPSVFVATVSSSTVGGAGARARRPAAVYVEHPMDRTDAEMTAIADKAIDEILANLVREDG
jgi:hypothetical protein